MPRVSDQQRHKLEAAIAAALTLLYLGAARSAAMDLGVPPPTDPPEDAQQGIADKAAKTALLVQQGINYQMDPPADSVYAGVPQADLLAGARGYNDNTLIPYLTSWGSHQGLVDTYRNTPQTTTDPMAEASSQAQAYLWEWTRLSGSDLADECGDAEGLGPAPFDDIMAITQGVPPLHRNCACDLSPAGRIPAESAAPHRSQ